MSMLRPSGRKRGERQTCAQILRAIRGARAELSQADRIAIEAGDDFSARVRFERDVTAEPGGNGCRRCSAALSLFRERASRMALRYGDESD